MTRETKVGLVVASSFLILVCIVVASKWKNGDEPGPEHESENKLAALTSQENKSVVKPTEPPKKKEQDPVIPAFPPKQVEPTNTLPTNNIQPQKPDPTIDQLKKNVELAQNQGQGGLFLPPPPPMANNKDTVIPQLPNSAPMDVNKPLPPLDLAGLPNVNDDPTKNAAIPMFPFPEPKKEVEKKNADIIPQAPTPKQDGSPNFPPLAPLKKDEVGIPPLDNKKNETPMFPPLEKPKDNGTFPPLAPLKKENDPTLPAVVTKPIEGPPTFPQKNDNVVLPPNAFAPKEAAPIAPLTNREQPQFPGGAKDNVPTIKPLPMNDPFPKQDGFPAAPLITNPNNVTKPNEPFFPESAKTIPPIGAHELPSAPTIGIGGLKPTPTPVEHKIDFVETRVGETNFAEISKRLYGTDRYANALFAYNYAHKDMIKNGVNLGSNPPILNAGQQLLHPAPELLQRDYAKWIQETAPTIPSAKPAVSLVPPSVATPQTSPPIATVSNPPAGQGRSYVVQSPNGERIRDIAQRALGNADRWTEIYRVNQNLNLQPQFPLPAGTRLQLPAN